jgi:hypothetical protein
MPENEMRLLNQSQWQVLLWMKPGENPSRQIQTH